jgi:hypothetical protein
MSPLGPREAVPVPSRRRRRRGGQARSAEGRVDVDDDTVSLPSRDADEVQLGKGPQGLLAKGEFGS